MLKFLCKLFDLTKSYEREQMGMYSVVHWLHCIELPPTPLPQTPHRRLTDFCICFWLYPLIIASVLFIFTLILYSPRYPSAHFWLDHLQFQLSQPSHQHTTLMVRQLNSLDMSSMTIRNNIGLSAEPWCIPHKLVHLLPQNIYCCHKVFWRLCL